jgi:hypothetical protein
MANPTTNYGFVLPTSTDLVTDLPADFDVALQGVDTRLKALQPGTTLGDIAYSSATANTNTRLGIGTTGQILSVSGGVPAWATPASSAPTSASQRVAANEATTSGSYTNLTTSGPAVTITTGTKALVIISSISFNTQAGGGEVGSLMSFAVSGATTTAASDSYRVSCGGLDANGYLSASRAFVITLTAGSNTFTAKYRVDQGTGYWQAREITVIDLGS